MNMFDLLDWLPIFRRKTWSLIATLLAIGLVLGIRLFPTETTNFLSGQALKHAQTEINGLSQITHPKCSVAQLSLIDPPTFGCKPVLTTTTTTSTTTTTTTTTLPLGA